jgi:hypothetical protein
MEHRLLPRIQCNIQVLLFKQRMPVAIGTITNINRYGVFIDTEFNDVAHNAQLAIEVLDRMTPDRYRINAVVVHKDAGGMGLEVNEHCATSARVLLQLIADHVSVSAEDNLSAFAY